ncbi:TPA: glycoside hydrolase family 39, partial [Klebsiella pneumoniae]|nr:glycoside hydrolase family 39 [Klebsiella pneumoniae]
MSSPELSKKQGISIIRIDVPWSEIESVKGNYDYTKYDNEIIRAKKLGYDVLPVLAYAPVWNKSIKGKIGSPPLETSSWNGFVESTVKRYRAYPYNITYFQVWNEPTLKAKFWLGNNEDFVNKIYIPAAKIIKKNNGKVVFGGWPLSNSISEFDYVLEG